MLGYGGARGIAGLVPAGRDVPIGLEIARFLGSSNPFGHDPFAKPKAKQDEEDTSNFMLTQSRPQPSLVKPNPTMAMDPLLTRAC